VTRPLAAVEGSLTLRPTQFQSHRFLSWEPVHGVRCAMDHGLQWCKIVGVRPEGEPAKWPPCMLLLVRLLSSSLDVETLSLPKTAQLVETVPRAGPGRHRLPPVVK
jgi:hypothetical protein